MAKTGRKPGFKMPEEHRSKLRTAQHLNILDKAACGEIQIPDSQFRALELSLRKALPDLKAIEHTGNSESPITVQTIVTGVVRAGEKKA